MKPRTRPKRSPFVGAHLAVLWALGVAFASSCGGGNDRPIPRLGPAASPPRAQVPPPVPAPPPVSALHEAALRLYESAAVHASLAASPFGYTLYDDDTVWTDWPCYQLSLDGQPPSPRTVLPTGSHTYAVTFTNCYVDFLVGTRLDGTASVAYTSADLNDVTTALVSVNSMRGTLVAYRSDLYDVTANGSGMWTRVRTGEPRTTSATETTTYTPTIGSTLVNNATGNVATFGGGSYSSGYGPVPPGSASAGHVELKDLI